MNYTILKDIFLICFAILSTSFILGRLCQKITNRFEIALHIFASIDKNLTGLNEKLETVVTNAKSRHTERSERIA